MWRSLDRLLFQKIDPARAIEVSTWFNLSINCQIEITYNLMRIAEACHEHVDNNFLPLPEQQREEARTLCSRVNELILLAAKSIEDMYTEQIIELRHSCDVLKSALSNHTRDTYARIRQDEDGRNIAAMYIYVNMLQELQEVVSNLRKLLRADAKLMLSPETRIRQ